MYGAGSWIEFGGGVTEDLLLADYNNSLQRTLSKAMIDGSKRYLLNKIPRNELTKQFIGQNASMASKYFQNNYKLIYYGPNNYTIIPK